jgi:hypothetical protein
MRRVDQYITVDVAAVTVRLRHPPPVPARRRPVTPHKFCLAPFLRGILCDMLSQITP